MLKAINITKEFPGVKALSNVSFEVRENEILALVGENGAGKSTLMKILSGVYPQNSFHGKIILNGKEVEFTNIKDAETAGISIIHQELNLIPELSIAENIYLSRLPLKGLFNQIDYKKLYADTEKLLKDLNLNLAPQMKVGDLSIGLQQLVEIAKAISKDSQLFIFDEPTSSLSEKEIVNLKSFLKNLATEKKKTLIYISHKLEEVLELSQRITVLRDGQTVTTLITKDVTKEEIIKNMVGRELSKLYPTKVAVKTESKINLSVSNLNVWNKAQDKKILHDVSFNVYEGEIVGFAGIVGSGRTELVEAIFGNSKFKTMGTINIHGKAHPLENIHASIMSKMGLVTEDRKHTGIHLHLSVLKNASITDLKKYCQFGVIDKEKEITGVEKFIAELRIKTPHPFVKVGNLSGGNQQKVAIAKWLNINPKILILDEPTRGVDVGAKFEIYTILQNLCAKGVSIIVVSSELPEIIGLCHRTYVMKDGKVAGELRMNEMTEVNMMKLAVS